MYGGHVSLSSRTLLGMVFLPALLAAGCAANQANIGSYDQNVSDVIVDKLGYDDSGLPVIGPPLEKRPSRPGEHFTLVQLVNGRPVISYDIVVAKQRPDITNPFKTIYSWTGKGFTAWGPPGRRDVEPNVTMSKGDDNLALIYYAILATPMTIGAVGGFVVGVADGVKQAGVELSKVVQNEEKIVTCTVFVYDGLNRLSGMRMYLPDKSRELVQTWYEYEDTGPKPARGVVKNLIDGNEWNVK